LQNQYIFEKEFQVKAMTIDIQYIKMPTSETMSIYVTQKLEKLTKKYDWLIKAQVFFKLDQDNTGNNSICTIELSAPGPRIFATSQEKNFETAVKETISELQKQIKKRKATLNSH
jgi:putative sigma-54 modulation protein